jgi:hypothetical protein
MLYALRGTPFVYQGEELCLPDAEIPPDRVVDVDGRDPERAPIPWEPPSRQGRARASPPASRGCPLIAEAEELCVARQAADPDSALSLYRRLAELRAGSEALQTGSQRTLDLGPGLLAWVREAGDERHPRDRQLPRHRVGAAAGRGVADPLQPAGPERMGGIAGRPTRPSSYAWSHDPLVDPAGGDVHRRRRARRVGGTTLDVIGICLGGFAAVGALSLAFLAVGRGEDRARGGGGGGAARLSAAERGWAAGVDAAAPAREH